MKVCGPALHHIAWHVGISFKGHTTQHASQGPWRWNIPLKKDKTWDLATLSQK